MAGIAGDVCQLQPDVVYLAGRTAALQSLVQALSNRTCPEKPVRVFTGSDAAAFATAVTRGSPGLREALATNVSVSFTNLASPHAWNAVPAAFSARSVAALRGPCDQFCFPRVFPNESLADGASIVGFDAMLSVVLSVRSPVGVNDSPELVTQYLPRVHDDAAIPGASGWISWDETGQAANKAVPIIVVDPTGAVRFDRLSSTVGSPRIPGRSPC